MRPLISGAEAKRYEAPETDTYILFPYELDAKGKMGLIPQPDMEERFGKAWAYLRSWEAQLRGREPKVKDGEAVRPFDDHQWYRFGRSQNIDKQDRPKLIVAQTVPSMRVCLDADGSKYLNNVRVNGILAPTRGVMNFLLGVLNGPVADYVFRRIGKPKDGGWFEANKQFIAPLPVPRASPESQAAIGALALALQDQTTNLRAVMRAAEERLAVLPRNGRPSEWLWPDLPNQPELEADAPRQLRDFVDRQAWAQARLAEAVAERLAALQAHLVRDAKLEATFSDGELRLLAGGASVIRGVYLDADEGVLIQAYWHWLLLRSRPSEANDFAKDLQRPPTGATTPAARQFIVKVAEIDAAKAKILGLETEINSLLFDLYGLTNDERKLVMEG